MRIKALAVLACLSLLSLPASAAPYVNSVNVSVLVLGSEPALYTDGMVRVVPVWVAIANGPNTDYARVYCVGTQVSWKCRNLAQMSLQDMTGHLDFGLRLSDGTSPYITVSPAIVVDAVQPHI